MNAVIINGQKKHFGLDIFAWLLALAVLAGIPLAVGMVRTPPAIGPTLDPSILIIFITLLVLIGLSTLGTYGVMFAKRTDQALGINILNYQAKFIGALFIVSGFVKLQDPVGFGYKLDEYWDVFQGYVSFFPNDFMKSISVPFAAFVSVIEVTLAIALMVGWRMRLTATILLLMILFFTGLTGFSAITGAVTDCGCFGDALKLTPMQTFLKDILLTIAILPFFLLRRRMWAFYKQPIPNLATLIALFIPAGISYYCYQHYPLLDFRGAYVVGQDLKYNSTEQNGEVIAHDFYEFAADCDHDGFQGPTLYIILYNLHKAPTEALDAAAALAADLKAKAPGIFVVGGTNTTKSERAKIPMKFPEGFCWSGQDEKMLKTLVRSSPGYFFMQDGIVVKKWHYNDAPSVDELRKLAGPAADIAPEIPAADSLTADSLAVDSASQDSSPHP